jgi:nucleoside-diphosphate-sugar epimerase
MPTLSEVRTEAHLVQTLSRPYPEDVAAARELEGDLIVLGAGGKMGPTLVRRIVLAVREAGGANRIFAASRFTDPGSRREIEDAGALAIGVDLLDDGALLELPDCPNVVYLAGMKFGASGRLPLTWAMNAYLPGRIADHYRDARIVALSTGNVYPQVPVASNGASEDVAPEPVGEYAQSCLGRERIFQHFSERNGTPVCLIRLNYAVEARYGVLLDIAQKVASGTPVSLETACVNAIWQGDANSAVFRALELCSSPAAILNVTGPEVLRVRDLAERFAARFNVDARFQGTERPTALLNDASRSHARLGAPKVTVDEVVELVSSWVQQGGTTHGKPTKFEVRNGRF